MVWSRSSSCPATHGSAGDPVPSRSSTSTPRDGHPAVHRFRARRPAPTESRSCPPQPRQMKPADFRGRPRPTAFSDRRSVRDRIRDAGTGGCRSAQGDHHRSGHAADLQGLLQQGANRSSVASYRGPGIEAGLKALQGVQRLFALPVLTDVHEDTPIAEVAAVVDVLRSRLRFCAVEDQFHPQCRGWPPDGRSTSVAKGKSSRPGRCRTWSIRRALPATSRSWCANAASVSVTTIWSQTCVRCR